MWLHIYSWKRMSTTCIAKECGSFSCLVCFMDEISVLKRNKSEKGGQVKNSPLTERNCKIMSKKKAFQWSLCFLFFFHTLFSLTDLFSFDPTKDPGFPAVYETNQPKPHLLPCYIQLRFNKTWKARRKEKKYGRKGRKGKQKHLVLPLVFFPFCLVLSMSIWTDRQRMKSKDKCALQAKLKWRSRDLTPGKK